MSIHQVVIIRIRLLFLFMFIRFHYINLQFQVKSLTNNLEESLSSEVILKETIKQKETIIEDQKIKVSDINIIILVLGLVFETLRLCNTRTINSLFRSHFYLLRQKSRENTNKFTKKTYVHNKEYYRNFHRRDVIHCVRAIICAVRKFS